MLSLIFSSRFGVLLAFFLVLFGYSGAKADTPNVVQEDHPVESASKFKVRTKKVPSLPTLYLVGDSTMKNGTNGQEGWGDEMDAYFDLQKINVVNEAIGGRSSRTFQSEGRWDGVLAVLEKGDFVVIQFGHNDPGPINDNFRARGSIKGVGEETQEIDNLLTKKHETIHTFGWYMRKYIADVKAKGAIPIVLSLVPRNSWKEGKVVRSTGENYAGWAKQAAESAGAAYIDDNEIIAEALDALGQEKAGPLFADAKLHSNHEGAQLNARCAVSGLKSLPGNPMGAYFSVEADKVPAFVEAKP